MSLMSGMVGKPPARPVRPPPPGTGKPTPTHQSPDKPTPAEAPRPENDRAAAPKGTGESPLKKSPSKKMSPLKKSLSITKKFPPIPAKSWIPKRSSQTKIEVSRSTSADGITGSDSRTDASSGLKPIQGSPGQGSPGRTSQSVRARPPPRPAASPALRQRSATQTVIGSPKLDGPDRPRKPASLGNVAPGPAITALDMGAHLNEENTRRAPDCLAPVATKLTTRSPGSPCYSVALDYVAQSEHELTVSKGEGIMLLDEAADENGWILVMSDAGGEGYLPVTYLED